MNWRPIKTAPEKTYVLAFQPKGDPAIYVAIYDEGDGGWLIDTQTGWDHCDPTHWYPLPKPPKVTA
jgi:hypothetical protein